MIDKMAKGLTVKLNEQVTRIEHDLDQVRVTTLTGNVYKCDKLLVTVPLGYKTHNKRFLKLSVFCRVIKLSLYLRYLKIKWKL
jgi:thioredoxin reductase